MPSPTAATTLNTDEYDFDKLTNRFAEERHASQQTETSELVTEDQGHILIDIGAKPLQPNLPSAWDTQRPAESNPPEHSGSATLP